MKRRVEFSESGILAKFADHQVSFHSAEISRATTPTEWAVCLRRYRRLLAVWIWQQFKVTWFIVSHEYGSHVWKYSAFCSSLDNFSTPTRNWLLFVLTNIRLWSKSYPIPDMFGEFRPNPL